MLVSGELMTFRAFRGKSSGLFVSVSTGHVSPGSTMLSPLSFITSSFLADSIWVICGEVGNETKVQLD